MSNEGRLIVGSVTRSAPATPVLKPNERNVPIIGISAAVGMTKSVPATAKRMTARMPLANPLPREGNIQARAAPNRRTVMI
ncbi:hypothetical protein D3C71_2107930 [compost metagenome]